MLILHWGLYVGSYGPLVGLQGAPSISTVPGPRILHFNHWVQPPLTSLNGKKMCAIDRSEADENIVRKIVCVKSELCVIGFSGIFTLLLQLSTYRPTDQKRLMLPRTTTQTDIHASGLASFLQKRCGQSVSDDWMLIHSRRLRNLKQKHTHI